MKRVMGLMLLFPTVLCNLCIRNKTDGFLVDFNVNVVSSITLSVDPDPRVGVYVSIKLHLVCFS